MIAFFFTMPMSRISPISAITVKSVFVTEQRQHRAGARRRQRRQNRQRMDQALVEHAEHDVDRRERRGDQPRLVGERLLEHPRGSLESTVKADRHADVARRTIDRLDGIAKRRAWPAD